MILVLLDTNAYLRLAKRIKPMLGVQFGQKDYVLTILQDVEDEVYASSRLKFKFPWFDAEALKQERLAKRVRLSAEEQAQLKAAASILRGWALSNADNYKNPPSPTDCRVLAFGQLRSAIVVTDDLSMHRLAGEFSIPVWHGFELLKKMLSAKVIDKALVREIFDALEVNQEMTETWKTAKHSVFATIFGRAPRS